MGKFFFYINKLSTNLFFLKYLRDEIFKRINNQVNVTNCLFAFKVFFVIYELQFQINWKIKLPLFYKYLKKNITRTWLQEMSFEMVKMYNLKIIFIYIMYIYIYGKFFFYWEFFLSKIILYSIFIMPKKTPNKKKTCHIIIRSIFIFDKLKRYESKSDDR